MNLQRTVRSIEVRRQELEHLAIKRWNTLDTLVLRALGMFLGAVFVTFVSDLKPEGYSLEQWYTLCMVTALAVTPLVILYVTKYKPPMEITIMNGKDKLEFRMLENVRVALYLNDQLAIPDIASLSVACADGKMVIHEAEVDEPLTVNIVANPFPHEQLRFAFAMISDVNESEFASCRVDIQLLTGKVVIQVLCWSVRDFVARSTFHRWQVNEAEDLNFALAFVAIYWVFTWVVKIFQLKPLAQYHTAPFMTAQEKLNTSLKRVLAAYLEVVLSCLPLSVGYSFNQVTQGLHMKVMEACNVQMLDASRSDYYGSVVLFSYAVYFLALATITISLRVYAKSIFALIFRYQLFRKCIDAIDRWLCFCSCWEKDEEPAEGVQAVMSEVSLVEKPTTPAASQALKAEEEAAEAAKKAAPPSDDEAQKQELPQAGSGSPVVAPAEKAVKLHAVRIVDPEPEAENDGASEADPMETKQSSDVTQSHIDSRSSEAESGLRRQLVLMEKKIKMLEKALGVSGTPPRHVDEPSDPIVNRHWKAVTLATADQVSLKTLQFLFAWALLYLIEHFFYVYVVECSRNAGDPWPDMCTFHSSLALSVTLSIFSFAYLYQIAGLRRQATIRSAAFDLQEQALPLLVGWTWKAAADDVLDRLKVEWADGSQLAVYAILFGTLYVFSILTFHTYSIISKDHRSKYAALEFA